MNLAHRRGIGTIVIAGALALAGCGDTSTVPAASAPASTTVSPSSTIATPTAPTTMPAPTTVEAECPLERKTLEVAVEAYVASAGDVPPSESALVEAGLLRQEIAAYDLVTGTADVVRAQGVACEERTQPSEQPPTADQLYAGLTEEEIAQIGGPECAREATEMLAAAAAFYTREGRYPELPEELTEDLVVAVTLYRYDADEGLIAAPGSGCVDLNDTSGPDQCTTERKALEVAVEAYVANLGGDVLPDEADLLSADYLRMESDIYDVVEGQITPTPGGGCD